jgi:hypothetical protein
VDKDGETKNRETKNRSAVFDRHGKATKIGLGRPIARILRECASLIHRLYAVDVRQNKRTVSTVADTRKVIIVSANQPMVEVSTDSCHIGMS